MPLQSKTIDLTLAGRHVVVPAGQIINGLTVSRSPSGVAYGVVFGNNPAAGPIEGVTTWVFGSNTPREDVSKGVWIETLVPNPGLSLDVIVSFTTVNT